MTNQGLPVIEYHLEIIGPNGSHGDYGARTPFPAFSIGDVVWPRSFPTGGTMGMPDSEEWVVSRVEHFIEYLDPPVNAIHLTTALITQARPRQRR